MKLSNWDVMLPILLFVVLLGMIVGLVYISIPEHNMYCGQIIQMYRTDAGYKSNPEAHVVFYCPATGRNIDVDVSFNCYANEKVGNKVCFELTDYQAK